MYLLSCWWLRTCGEGAPHSWVANYGTIVGPGLFFAIRPPLSSMYTPAPSPFRLYFCVYDSKDFVLDYSMKLVCFSHSIVCVFSEQYRLIKCHNLMPETRSTPPPFHLPQTLENGPVLKLYFATGYKRDLCVLLEIYHAVQEDQLGEFAPSFPQE